jgi:transposase-like protein
MWPLSPQGDSFRNDGAAMKLFWLVLRDVAKKWYHSPAYWRRVKTQPAIMFKERLADVA